MWEGRFFVDWSVVRRKRREESEIGKTKGVALLLRAGDGAGNIRKSALRRLESRETGIGKICLSLERKMQLKRSEWCCR